MSGKHPISIDAKDPEYYTEILGNLNTSRLAHRHLPSDERPCPDIPGIQGVGSPLSRRLQTLLDALADISLYERGNVSATMASLRNNCGTLETQLYIVFNRELEDGEVHHCRRHVETIFNKLRQVPYEPPAPATDGSSNIIADSLEFFLLDLCKVIHDYSFNVFAYRVNKRKKRLSEIRGYIEQDQTEHFGSRDRSKLAMFFRHVDGIILAVAKVQATKKLTDTSIQLILAIYSYWTEHNLLPDLSVAGDKLTLLDHVDTWLAEKHEVDIQLRRWAQKIMSFVISASRLFTLTQSNRLRKVILGKFSVEFLTSPTAAPYSCNLSSEAIRAVLNDTLTGSRYLSVYWDADRESFINQLKGLEVPEVVRRFDPTVHAELAMVMAMVKGDIPHVLPYIGVSKLCCIMCSHYIHTFNEVMGQTITIRGSHGKAYPGWSWPSILPDHDEELRGAFLKGIRQQLRSDFEHYAQNHRRGSDSSVGSGGPGLQLHRTRVDILELIGAVRAEAAK